MATRTGLPSIYKIARELCRLLTKFGPVIRALYPDNATLLAALAAAETACHNLVDEIKAAVEPGD